MRILVVAIFLLGAFTLFFIFASFYGFPLGEDLDKQKLRVGDAVFKVEIADDPLKSARGLSGRAHLPEDEGMMFIFSRAGHYPFWMRGMEFPLDFVWIRESKVVGIDPNVPIRHGVSSFKTVVSKEPVDMVLEINAGISNEVGIEVGDIVTLE